MKDLHARTPIDSTSAKVVSDGHHWNPDLPSSGSHDTYQFHPEVYATNECRRLLREMPVFRASEMAQFASNQG